MAPLAVWKVTVMFYEATGTWPPPPGPPDPAPPPPASLIISPDFFSLSCTSMSTMGMAEKVLLNTPHVLSALNPANSRYSSRPRRRPLSGTERLRNKAARQPPPPRSRGRPADTGADIESKA